MDTEESGTDMPYIPTPQHIADIRIIGEYLQREAIERDWCNEFTEFIDRVNSDPRLIVPLSETRTVETTATVTFSLDIRTDMEVIDPNNTEAIATILHRKLTRIAQEIGIDDAPEVTYQYVSDVRIGNHITVR